jgi:hypothetical protein
VPSSVFEPAIPAVVMSQTNAVDCTATEMGNVVLVNCKNQLSQSLENEDLEP